MKKLNLITILLAVFIVLMGCKKECAFVYSGWTSCSNNIQTRTYTSSPSGCTGTPPADSLQRSCVILPTVQIGNQTWTTKNLDEPNYRNGDPIPQVQDGTAWSNLTTGAWCYYDNNAANGTTHGKLYNWYAVNDPRGLAPNGYHIPTDNEWKILIDYLGGESVAGTKMKSTSGWDNNGNGTNSSGFGGLPGAYRGSSDGFFTLIFGAKGFWWSSSEFNTGYAWGRNLDYNYDDASSYIGNKRDGFSVRCIKD